MITNRVQFDFDATTLGVETKLGLTNIEKFVIVNKNTDFLIDCL